MPEIGNDDPFILRVTQKPDDLGVILVPDDDGGVALLGVAFDNGLDFDDPGTGGVDDLEAGLLEFFKFLGRNAVGPDDHRSWFFSGRVAQNGNPFFLQHPQDLGIVDQGAVGVNGVLMAVGGLQDDFHGPSHPHAEPGGFS